MHHKKTQSGRDGMLCKNIAVFVQPHPRASAYGHSSYADGNCCWGFPWALPQITGFARGLSGRQAGRQAGSPDEVRLDKAPRPHEEVQDGGGADYAPAGPSRPIEPAVLRRSEDPQRLLHHETSGRQMAPGKSTEASAGEGSGGCLPGHLLLRLGASKPAGHVGASVGLRGLSTEATQQGVSLRARRGLSTMSARLPDSRMLRIFGMQTVSFRQ